MLKNYIKIAARYIWKEGTYSVIKIAGLAIGLTALLLISLFLIEDLSFDAFHSKKDRIVRVLTIDSAQGVQSQEVGVSQVAMGPAAVAEIPEVENYARILGAGEWRFRYKDVEYKTEDGIFSDNTFFEVFDFKIVDGDRDSSLTRPNSVVLTESFADRIFGDEDPIGNELTLGQSQLNITAIVEDPPANSHIQFELVRSLVAPEDQPGWQQFLTNWGGINTWNYLLLDRPYEDLSEVTEKLIDLKTRNEAAEFFTPKLQHLNDVHLRSKHIIFENNHAKTDISNVYIMLTIGLVILMLASVNFMNLVTAKSAARALEIGVRKVMGGVRKQLIIQHLTESVLIVFVAFLFAVAITYLILPSLNNLYHRSAQFDWLLTPEIILSVSGFLLFLGLLAGSYPALFLSGFKPVEVMKGGFKAGKSGAFVRRMLVVFQFVISIALIAGAAVIYQQMNYIYTMDMGYDRDQVLTMVMSTQEMQQRAQVFEDGLRTIPGVVSVGTASTRIGNQLGRSSIHPEGTSDEDNYITSVMSFDHTYMDVMQMDLIDGRTFEEGSKSDSASALLINEELARMLNWDNPVGRTISMGPDENRTDFKVIGVIKDFNFATVQHPIEPLYVRYNQNNGVVHVRIAGDVAASMDRIEEYWASMFPDNAFEYSFMDDDFQVLYENEAAFASMFNHLTFLAIFIAVMGLFGLSAFAAEQRTKEIGIRKVLGAEVSQIVVMLSREFIILIIIAFMFAIPLAWYGADKWLEGFVYKTDLGWDVFALAAVISLVVAMITVSWQSIKAAISNPIRSLRDE